MTHRSRNHTITLRLNDEELESLNSKSSKSKLSREAFIRECIRKTKFVEPPGIEYYKLINELNAIGNNLNQLTRNANSNHLIDPIDLSSSLEMLNLTLKKLDNQIRGNK